MTTGPSVSRAPSLFGFAVTSDVPLNFLRDGGGAEALAIRTAPAELPRPAHSPLGEWPLHGTTYPAQASLYEVPGGFEYWTSDAGRFFVDLAGGRIEIPEAGDALLREQRLNGMPMLLSFSHRGDFSLHAAAVQVGNRAVILAAPSRFGKTTLAFAFHAHGHRLLSEDLACCRPGTMELLPGPTLVRLRPDVYPGAPPDGMHLIAARPDRIFLGLDAERAGDSTPVPIGGIVFLHEGEELWTTPVRAVEAVKDLWHLGFRLPSPEGRAKSFRMLTELAGAVPIWAVHRPLRMDRLEETVATVADLISA